MSKKKRKNGLMCLKRLLNALAYSSQRNVYSMIYKCDDTDAHIILYQEENYVIHFWSVFF